MRFFLLLLSCLLLGGCQSLGATFSNAISGTIDLVTGSGEVVDPPRELSKITPEIRIDILWDKDIGAGDQGRLLALTPASGGDMVYVADHEGDVQALDLRDGKEIWEVETEQPIASGPGLGYDSVLVGTSEAEVIALRRSDGETLWTSRVSSEVLAPPRAAQGVVVVHSSDGGVFAFDETDGKTLWSYEQRASPLNLRGCGAPVIDNDVALLGFSKGRLAAFRLSDGKILWERQVALPRGISEMERLVDIDSEAAIDDNVIYVTAYHGGVIAASLLDGEVIWRNDKIVANSQPAINWGNVFVTDVAGDVWGLDPNTGRAFWKQSELHRRQLTAPVIFKDYLVVGDFEGYLHFLSQEDGHLLGRIRLSRSPIRVAPVVQDEQLIIYASDGDLTVLTVESE